MLGKENDGLPETTKIQKYLIFLELMCGSSACNHGTEVRNT